MKEILLLENLLLRILLTVLTGQEPLIKGLELFMPLLIFTMQDHSITTTEV